MRPVIPGGCAPVLRGGRGNKWGMTHVVGISDCKVGTQGDVRKAQKSVAPLSRTERFQRSLRQGITPPHHGAVRSGRMQGPL